MQNLVISASHRHPLLARFKALKIPQVEIASRIGISHQMLNKYLLGYVPMPETIAAKLEQLLVNIGEYNDLENTMEKKQMSLLLEFDLNYKLSNSYINSNNDIEQQNLVKIFKQIKNSLELVQEDERNV